MSYEKVSTIAAFQGRSDDGFPFVAPGQDIPAGSTYHMVDTGDEFVFFNNVWTIDLRKARAFKNSLNLP